MTADEAAVDGPVLPTELPAGTRVRPAVRTDVDAIAALVTACEVHDDGAGEMHQSDIAQAFDLAPGRIVVAEDEAGIVAWATVADGRAQADVHPTHRGAGIGRSLMAWTEVTGRAAGDARVVQIVSDGDPAARRLFEARGYRSIGTSWVLEMPLGEAPAVVDVPAGIQLRAYSPGDAELVYRVVEDAFSEWPDREPTSFDRWRAHVPGHPAFAAHLSRLAFEGDRLVGVALSMDYAGLEQGWVDQLATVVGHRHRGIARALLGSVFEGFHATGRRVVGLSTNSRSGALGLYERLGMHIRRSYTGWAKDLD
jgi:mycothiol synthase